MLAAQGMAANQAVTFLTDGADDVRDLPLYLNPDSEHLIDWFHVTMRLTVLAQMAKSLPGAALADRRGTWCTDLDDDDLRHLDEDVARVPRHLERLKWGCRQGKPRTRHGSTTSPDAVTDGGGGADMRRASNRLIWADIHF